MRRARIRITPSLPARRAPSATAKAAAPTKPIDELKDDAKPEDDEKIVQIGKSSESLNEIQTRDKNDETVKIEKSSPSKLPKPTHNTPEFEQKKQEEPNLNDAFKTPEVHSKSVEESSDGSGTTQPVAGVPAKSRSRVKIMPHLKATRNISSLKPATSLVSYFEFPVNSVLY